MPSPPSVPDTSVAVDAEALGLWLAGTVPSAGGPEPIVVSRLGVATGTANELYRVQRGDDAWVLRRPPAVKNAPGASDMAREFRVLRALEGSSVPHPRAIAFCEDPSVIGNPFLVLELVDGFTPVDPLPPWFDTDLDARHELGTVLVDGLAELALVDWRAAGLDGFGKPDGFLERQVARWLGQLDRYRTRPLDGLDGLLAWLGANRPAMGAPGIIHGDFSLYNVLIAPERPVRLAAIIDWDTATIGDPMMDLGLLLARWQHDGEDIVGVVDIGDRSGLASREELAGRYADRSGRDVSAIAFYEVLALFKLACIIEGNYARAVRRADGSADAIAGIVPSLLRSAAAIAASRR